MNAMCGIDLYFAPSGLGMFLGIEPRALPWAIASCRVAASVGPNGVEWESPGCNPGLRSHLIKPALKGPDNTPRWFAEFEKLEQAIKPNLRGLGYGG